MYWTSDGMKVVVTSTSVDGVVSYTAGTPWDVTTLTEDEVFSATADDSSGHKNVTFSPDGLLMHFLIDNSYNVVRQYELDSAFDLSSVNVSFFSPINYGAETFLIADSGTKLFSTEGSNLYEHDLTIPWEISSAQPVENYSTDLTGQSTLIRQFAWSTDGLTLFASDRDAAGTNAIYQYTTAVPFDGYNISFSGIVNNSTTYLGFVSDISWSPDGSKLYVTEDSLFSFVYQYETSNYDIENLEGPAYHSVDLTNDNVNKINWSDDGYKFFVTANGTGAVINTDYSVWEFETPIPWNTSTASYVQREVIEPLIYSAAKTFWNGDGSKLYVINSFSVTPHRTTMFELDLDTPWDVSTVNRGWYTITGTENKIKFSSDGYTMFARTTGDSFRSFAINEPWVIEDRDNEPQLTYERPFWIASQATGLDDYAWSPDGLKYIKVGDDLSIREYDAAIPYRLDTLSYTGNIFSPWFDYGLPLGNLVSFSPNGQKMFMYQDDGVSGDRPIYQFNIQDDSDAWDFTGASFVETFQINRGTPFVQPNDYQGLSWSGDGYTLFASHANSTNYKMAKTFIFEEQPEDMSTFPGLIADIDANNAIDGGGTTTNIPDASGNGFDFIGPNPITLNTSDPAYNNNASITPSVATEYLQNLNIPVPRVCMVYIVAEYVDAQGTIFGSNSENNYPSVGTDSSGFPELIDGFSGPSTAKPASGTVCVWSGAYRNFNWGANVLTNFDSELRLDPQGGAIVEDASFGSNTEIMVGIKILTNYNNTLGHPGSFSRIIICSGYHEPEKQEEIINLLKTQYNIITT